MLIELKHQACDYTCMWNGLEDIYRQKTNHVLPPRFFFGLSGLCNFVFLNQSKSPTPKSVFWSDGRPKKMYEFMSAKVGFSYSVMEDGTFPRALSALKRQLDAGNPVVAGALDMFWLEYLPKFYQKLHVPIHYVLAVGYDEAREEILLYDCGREGLQRLSYANLGRAWNVNAEGLSKKNTLYRLDFSGRLADPETIFYAALKEKCGANLHAPVSFIGVKGIRKLAKDIVTWEGRLDEAAYRRCLLQLVEYAGFPPMLPDPANPSGIRHTGARLEFAGLLNWAAEEYRQEAFRLAASDFERSGGLIEALSYALLAVARGKGRMSAEIGDRLEEIASLEESAYKKLKLTL